MRPPTRLGRATRSAPSCKSRERFMLQPRAGKAVNAALDQALVSALTHVPISKHDRTGPISIWHHGNRGDSSTRIQIERWQITSARCPNPASWASPTLPEVGGSTRTAQSASSWLTAGQTIATRLRPRSSPPRSFALGGRGRRGPFIVYQPAAASRVNPGCHSLPSDSIACSGP